MAYYDYREGKKRVEEILRTRLDEIDNNNFPSSENALTFTNGYYSWVSAIFVDIRDSSTLFADEDREKVSKVIRAFTSEIIEILRLKQQGQKDDRLREIGIRGDCVYAVYITPQKSDVYDLAEKTFYINTYMNMLNKLLEKNNLPKIRVGIGMSTAKELIIKAGRMYSGVNSKVWIGKAVTRAAKFSAIANKFVVDHYNDVLVFSSTSYDNFIDELEQNNKDEKPREWLKNHYDDKFGYYYTGSIIKIDFINWINDGMRD